MFPRHAIVSRKAADSDVRADQFIYRGTFKGWGTAETRRTGTKSFDLATVDLPTLARLLSGAAQTLKVPDGSVDQVAFGYPSGEAEDAPVITIYVRNATGRSGHMVVAFDGEPLAVYPPSN